VGTMTALKSGIHKTALNRLGLIPRVAALYVQSNGTYYKSPGVEPWGLPHRDAREYAGPWPVVAHPPCERWGRYWSGGPSHAGTYRKGDDGGCFAAALASVRAWGGVLEHPADSSAWAAHGLLPPPRKGGWVAAGDGIGWTCRVEQGHYGHLAAKPTWLYAVSCTLPELTWGPAPETWKSDMTRSARWRARAEREGVCVMLSRAQRAATPPAFRDVLLAMARTVKAPNVVLPKVAASEVRQELERQAQ